MMTASESILSRLRATCGSNDAEERRAEAQQRLAEHPRNIIPARALITDAKERAALFRAMAEEVGTSFADLASLADVPGAAADFLRRQGLPLRLRMGADAALAGLDWPAAGIETRRGAAAADDEAGLSRAFCAIAETGTLMLLSGADNPATVNFLPDNHIVALASSDIVGSYEDAWERLRQNLGGDAMPRAVNWISGPSRTADIEQTLVMGAHGPRRLHILLINDSE